MRPAPARVLPGRRRNAVYPRGARLCARRLCAGAPVQLQQRAVEKEREVAVSLRCSSWETKAKTNDK